MVCAYISWLKVFVSDIRSLILTWKPLPAQGDAQTTMLININTKLLQEILSRWEGLAQCQEGAGGWVPSWVSALFTLPAASEVHSSSGDHRVPRGETLAQWSPGKPEIREYGPFGWWLMYHFPSPLCRMQGFGYR